ncbi:flagellar assembly factor FliW [Frondihabitans sp. PhB188]|uniref:flagellar assembly protein FliW n=1 Tax=Frondihabitans sp. PhB188 TaxID=2485200 RepID=UPI000F495449|nr:flagellar assembly protein FliW [Frondihabitans sp. PhB188]ROQ37329.1 flagellar assembly factor FliW [Frondihabitans sp. PhB188]
MSASLSFVTPPPGLDPLVDFTLDEISGAAGLYSLHASDEPAKRLFVVDASVHLGHYSPEISTEQADLLGLTTPADALLLVVANPAPEGTTVNLMAPIVVNVTTGAAAQLILDEQEWPLRAPLAPARAAAPAARPAATPASVASRAKAPVLA